MPRIDPDATENKNSPAGGKKKPTELVGRAPSERASFRLYRFIDVHLCIASENFRAIARPHGFFATLANTRNGNTLCVRQPPGILL